jgi:hypothetical protein
MSVVNLPLVKNPVNWLVIPSLALFGLIFAALISAPFRA